MLTPVPLAALDFLPIFAAKKVKEILRRRDAAGREDYPREEPILPLWMKPAR